MFFDPFTSDLPIKEVIPETRTQLAENNTLIVSAPAGAGKSTLLPLALLNEPWLDGKKILMLEPRRLAARTIAARMSFLLDEEVGNTVGFRIRFENCTSTSTRIEVLTEGILTRMLLSDNSLEGVGMVIFDEFHERSIYADTALALCREAQQVLRPDLRIMIMSATLNMPHLTSLLNAPVIESQGRQYPVEIIYTGERDMMVLPELTTRIINRAVKEKDGDILVFLPGEAEIRKCEEILKGKFRDIAIHPLYGMLPFNQQTSAIMPNRNGKRKIVLATSIAETSLTIEGIKVVVDTGYGRTLKFDPKSELSRLETIEISKDSADQRAGRAGRLAPGTCYRMWTKATNDRMQDHRIPEILEADLAPLVLDMAQWGIIDIRQMTWLDPPPKANLEQASETLHMLDALENGRITEQGKRMHELPCHPRIAHMLLMAKEFNHSLAHATDIAAILEERDPLPKDSGIDINLRIEALRKQRSEKRLQRTMERIEKIASSYRQILGIDEENSTVDPYETGVLLVYAYPERIAHSRPGNNAQFQLANGSYAMAGHKDDLAHEQWLAVSHVDARDGMGKIFMASPLNPRDLAPLVKETETITWDTRKGGLVASKDLKIGSIVLQSKPLPAPDQKFLVQAISDALKKEGKNLLDFNEDVEQWQNRVLSLRKWRPQENWPDVSTHTLLLTNIEWLGPALGNIRKPEVLKKIDLLPLLNHLLNSAPCTVLSAPQSTGHCAQCTEFVLNKLAPQRISVPSGSNIKIKYFANGDAPVLAVRLQEIFGLAETPRINDGRTPLLIHLLSPGYKPVQVTSDLHSFWNNAYHEVKKELKIKYPKHAWPDDPWNAKAIRK